MTHASRIVYFAFTLALAACGKKEPAPRTAEEIAQKTAETNEQIQKTTEELTKLAGEKTEATAEAEKAKDKLTDAQSAEGKDKPSEQTIETLKADVAKKTDEVTAVSEQSAQAEKELAALKAERARLEDEARALEAEKARQAQADAEKKTAEESKKNEEAKAEKNDDATDGVFSLRDLLPSTPALFTIHPQKAPVRLDAPVFYPELKTKLPNNDRYTKFVRFNDDTLVTVSWMNEKLHILRFKVSTTTGDASERSFVDVPFKTDLLKEGFTKGILDARVNDKGGLDILLATEETVQLVRLDEKLGAVKKYSTRMFGATSSENISGLLLNDDTVVWSTEGELNVANGRLETSLIWCALPQRGYVGAKGARYRFDYALKLARTKDKNRFQAYSNVHGRDFLSFTRRVLLVEVLAKKEAAAAAVVGTCDGLRVVRETDQLDSESSVTLLTQSEGDAYFYGDDHTRVLKTASLPGIEPFTSEEKVIPQKASKTVTEETYMHVAPMVGTFAATEHNRFDFLNADLKVEKSYQHSATATSLRTVDSETKVVIASDYDGNLVLVDGVEGKLIETRNAIAKWDSSQDAPELMTVSDIRYISGDTIVMPLIVDKGGDISKIGFVRIRKKTK